MKVGCCLLLCVTGLENRLRLICDDLMGPTHSHAKLSKSWDTSVMVNVVFSLA